MMTYPACQTLLLDQQAGVLHITLNRPDSRNAMNLSMLEELIEVLTTAAADAQLRAIVMRGAGGHFCAGGDIKDMANARATGTDAYRELNRHFGRLLELAEQQPQVVLAVLEGTVLGGGLGLACIADIALCLDDARFGLPETSLGVIPAQIAPFVVKRIGLTQARRLALTAARFNGVEALRLGLVHQSVKTAEDLQIQLDSYLQQIRQCAPQANARTKALLLACGKQSMHSLLDQAAETFAQSVTGAEGAEGTQAFVQKRPPSWAD
ncbi:enoyl-CoA hydratase/isomerase family protein [Halopseudomonas pelagia]|uniref:enoyl-CoA hydratase/isomerase family protein n=1 Tax=Halopseudomonas pelagia TaxID=553151 RepID=UPI0012697DE0|nr:enoyl-CoA hydratase-related protein [Halopseudomonas pelagia]